MNIHVRRVAIGFTIAAAFAGLVLLVGIGGDETPAASAPATTEKPAPAATGFDHGDGYQLLSRSWSDGPVANDEPAPEQPPPASEADDPDRKFAEEAAKRWQNLDIAVGR